jgi:hypothetical protein
MIFFKNLLHRRTLPPPAALSTRLVTHLVILVVVWLLCPHPSVLLGLNPSAALAPLQNVKQPMILAPLLSLASMR